MAMIRDGRALITIVVERDERTGVGAVRDGQPAFAHPRMILSGMEPRPAVGRPRGMSIRLSIPLALGLVMVVAGCVGTTGPPSTIALPEPTCGGVKILIDGALPCDTVVEIAVATLAEQAPEQVGRGIEAIDVFLTGCPRFEIPPQVDCGMEDFAQMVTVSFAAAPPGGPIEPSLTVAVAPVSGRVMGIVNPLIR
jgi:hypothetical protein